MRLFFTIALFLLIFNKTINAQTDCAPSVTFAELNANQISAKLLIAGDLWWDTNYGGYFVTKNGSNEQALSLIHI